MFKKYVALLVILVVSSVSFPFQALATEAPAISIYMDGKELKFDVAPMVQDGSTFVPMRKVFESFGADISWDGKTSTVTAVKGNKTIRLTIGDDSALINSSPTPLSTPAILAQNTTMVPLRFIGESLGALVGWEGTTNTVTINTTDVKKVKVVRVIDGDTAVVVGLDDTSDFNDPNAVQTTVRFIGVNTPETVKPNTPPEPYGTEGSDHTKQVLTGKYVYIAKDKGDKDVYGRTLGYVYLEDGTFYNASLVAEGYAQAMTIPTNTEWATMFNALEDDARENQRGLWSKNLPYLAAKDLLIKKAADYGFQDGKFDPTKLVSRIDFTQMLVTAMFPETKVVFLAISSMVIGVLGSNL